MANEIYNTSWWGTALDTARTAGTNPDFFGSQMKLLTSEQDNIVTNGSFDTDSNWSTPTGWEIIDGKLKGTNVNAVSTTQGGYTFLNKSFKVVYTVSNYVQGDVRIYLGGSQPTLNRSANGTYTEYITITSANTTLYIQGINNFTGSIDNVSVQLVRCDLDQIEAKKCLADWIHTTALKDLNN